ncbi:hypothetical protein BDD12DRAFT_806633 [Trichophaea hybrida]|nr:hypothetical protein BDD12DRAFT_806633 [Trichophaea hybrida]
MQTLFTPRANPPTGHSFNKMTTAPILQTLASGSTSGSQALSRGEMAGLVVAIVGVLLTAMMVLYKGWKCWKSRRVSSHHLDFHFIGQADTTAVQNHSPPAITQTFYICLPTSLHPLPVSPEYSIPLASQPSSHSAPPRASVGRAST